MSLLNWVNEVADEKGHKIILKTGFHMLNPWFL